MMKDASIALSEAKWANSGFAYGSPTAAHL